MNEPVPSSNQQSGADARELRALGYAQELFRTMGGLEFRHLVLHHLDTHGGGDVVRARARDGGTGGDGLRVAARVAVHPGGRAVPGGARIIATDIGIHVPPGVASRRQRPGWLTAWFNITGQLSALAAIDYGCALFVTPLLGLPTPSEWLLLIYTAVLFITVILSSPDNVRAGKAMAGLTLLPGAWYVIDERTRFLGPAWASAHLNAGAGGRW